MDSKHWRQVDRLFQAALETDPNERAAFLDRECSGDDSLRKEVESLLDYDRQGLSLIDEPALDMVANLLGTPAPELSVGQHIGHYEILELLGTGGMGEVYLAQDTSLGRKIALKLLPADFTLDQERVRRFQQEARAASALNHPNILTIHEIGQFDNRNFIATEFIDGKTLRQLISGSMLNLIGALEVAVQVANALAAAHRAGIVHRDIKPENIMVRPDGYIKVLDFGLAKLTEQQSTTLETGPRAGEAEDTLPGVVLGTVKYMSPEQARGRRVDGRSDIFSLGVVLYEMITGHTPFEGETTSDLIASILKVDPPVLTEYSPDPTGELQRVVSRALCKDKQDRYQTVIEMLVDLKALKQELELHSKIQRAIHPAIGSVATIPTGASGVEVRTADELALSTGGGGAVHTQPSTGFIISRINLRRFRGKLAVSIGLVAIAASSYGLYKVIGFGKPSHFRSVTIKRLTTTGNVVYGAAISPDGRYVAYLEREGQQQNLWLRQVAASSSTLIATNTNIERQLTFSPDGNYLYYVANGNGNSKSIFKMPALGGVSQKLITGVDSYVAVSPDGKQLAFVRFYPNDEDAVIVANTDGSDERILDLRKPPRGYVSVAWSPDGKRLACVGGGLDREGAYGDLFEIDVGGGDPKALTDRRWAIIEDAAWLSDGDGLVVIAIGQEDASYQTWHISYPGKEARRITTDLNSYLGLSVARGSDALVSSQRVDFNNLYIQNGADTQSTRQLTFGSARGDGFTGLTWTPDGRIVYSSGASGRPDLWIMDADGRNQKQLTVGLGSGAAGLAVSPDGRYIVFVSDRAGPPQVWRVDIDGGNPKQLTYASQGRNPFFSPDSKWVYYLDGDKHASKVPVDGGDPVKLSSPFLDIVPRGFSPDGRLMAYVPSGGQEQGPKKLWIASSEGGEPIKKIDLPRGARPRQMQWTPDGHAITYSEQRGNVFNLWMQSLEGGPPKQLTNFTEYSLTNFAWSRDGKYLVYSRGFQVSDVVLIESVK